VQNNNFSALRSSFRTKILISLHSCSGARGVSPDALFVFVPTIQAGTFARQFAERELDKACIKLIGTGDITSDHDLPGMSDAMLARLSLLGS
jgi:hypothetical protein